MSLVSWENKDGIAVLTVDNPPMNVLSLDVSRQLASAANEIRDDATVLALIVTGSGGRAFMAGADIKEFPQFIEQGSAADAATAFDLTMEKIHRLEKPTIAALNGLTLGGGCELALACDFRIAEDGISIGFPEVKLGLFPGAGGTQRLPRLIGESRAKEMILRGEPVTADYAYRIGLVNEIVGRGQAVSRAMEFASVFRERSLVSISAAKRAIDEGLDLSLTEGLTLEATLFGEVFFSEDVSEGVRAFIEKRPPAFRHR